MALRALLPVGYMPSTAALQDGRFELVLCTPAGLVTVDSRALPGADQPEPPAEHPSAVDGPCVFAAAAPVAPVPPDPVAIAGAARSAERLALPIPADPHHSGRAVRPAHPRGPPLSV